MHKSECFQEGLRLFLPTRIVVKNQRGKICVGGDKYSISNGKFFSVSITFKISLKKTLGFYLPIDLFLYLAIVH